MEEKYSLKKPYPPNMKLKKERLHRSWTQKVLADKIDLADYHTVGRWERGEYTTSLHYCQKLVEVFDKSMEELGLIPSAQDESAPPPLPTLQAEPFYNIPHLLAPFIGRQREVAEICALLTRSDVHLVTLLGSGGIGKTRLALQVATQMRDHFSAGVCLVSLSAITDPVQVLPAIASDLALWENETLPLLEQLKLFLFDKKLLLVLDNFEQVVTAAPFIETLINFCPHLKVLVTSRHGLKLQGGNDFPVSPLPLPDCNSLLELEVLMENDAIALFIRRTQAHQPTFQLTEKNARAIAELCVHLDGLPLAIELAASRMQLFSPHKLLMRLPQSLFTLKNDADTIPERHRTLYNLIKWSYDLLNTQEQWFFRHLAIFAGATSLETIENFFGTGKQPLSAIEDRVLSLLNKSLLHHTDLADDDFRIVMLETIREFGLDCLRNNEELEESQQSHAIYYLHVIEKAALHFKGAEQHIWLQMIEKEQADLHAALTWLIAHEDGFLALRFCEAFGKFCGLRGYWSEEQRWLKAALALPQTVKSQRIRARVLRRAGHLAYRFRDLDSARTLHEESARLSREIEDKQNLAGALSGLGRVLNRQHEVTAASKLFLESVEVARASKDDWTLANTLECLGSFLHKQGQNTKAYACLAESLMLSRRLQDKETTVRTLNTLVAMELTQKKALQAMLYAQESFQLAQELGTKPLIALALASLGEVALFQKEYEQAKQYFAESIAIARHLNDTSAQASRNLRLVHIALIQHDSEIIYAFLAENHGIFPASPDIAGRAEMLARCQLYREQENGNSSTTQ